ncbi:hypothetical protein INS49_006669 [Diaporthe citri]|uniref:uncharacterized protein n=1 Tax=Diaporthe citri TaxID=83186 RepID=UPI001C807833|nr:uncharacterized protein INS49_006669 [Diaporthe citri]KAG6365063.1 hypothetical protein INS49_006669 [Diaporthe citri]
MATTANEKTPAISNVTLSDADEKDDKAPKEQTASLDEPQYDFDSEEFSSISDLVRNVVSFEDDPTLPTITFRSVLLASVFCIIGSVVSQLSYFRTTSAVFPVFFVILVSQPLGRLLARVLPDYRVPLGRFSFTLNPGPFSIKEHAIIGIAANSGSQGQWATYLPTNASLFYGLTMNPAVSLFFGWGASLLGFAFAAMVRIILIDDPEFIFPPSLQQVTLYRSMQGTSELHSALAKNKMKMFYIVSTVTFAWQFLPEFAFPMVAALAPLCCVQLVIFVAFAITTWILIPIAYFGNIWGSPTYDIMSNKLFTKNGTSYPFKTLRGSLLKPLERQPTAFRTDRLNRIQQRYPDVTKWECVGGPEGIMYALVGPKKLFASSYFSPVLWGFLVGGVAPALIWFLHQRFPRARFDLWNTTIFFASAATFRGNLSTGPFTTIIVGTVFNYYLYRYRHVWWNKWAYISGAALDTGFNLNLLFIFLFLGTTDVDNTVVAFPSPVYFVILDSDDETDDCSLHSVSPSVTSMTSISRILSRPTAKPYRNHHIIHSGEQPPNLDKDGNVAFDEGDIENPQNWSFARRTYITLCVVLLVVNATFASSSPSGCLESISEWFGVSTEAASLTVTLFLLGYCAGPLVFAPLSEFYGRRIIFYITFLAYTAFNFLCAFAPNFGSLLVGRFLTGTFVSAQLSNAPGVLADVWNPIERANAMAGFSLMVWAGPALGPVIGGFLQLTKGVDGWKWSFYVLLMLAGFTDIILFTVPETYAPVLLQKKARRIRAAKIPGYEDVKAPIETTNQSLVQIYKIALTRPWIIFFDTISFLCAIYMSVVYLLLYMLFSIYPIVFQQMRGWNSGVGELPLIGTVVGAAIGALIVMIDSRSQSKKVQGGFKPGPEDRLRLAMYGGPGFAASMFWLAWSANFNYVHWIVPTLAGVFLSASMLLIFVSFLNYLVDAYIMFAASAIAANTVLRSAAGAAAPLFTRQMFTALGVGGGGSLVGGVGTLLAIIPFAFYKYGRKIRERSRFAPTDVKNKHHHQEDQTDEAEKGEVVVDGEAAGGASDSQSTEAEGGRGGDSEEEKRFRN